MYCRVNPHANGLLESECKKIGGSPLLSAAIIAENTALPADAAPDIESSNVAMEPAIVAADSALSEELRNVLLQPRDLSNNLVPEIAELAESELNTVRSVISSRTDYDLLRGAVLILGERGNISDAQALISFLADTSVAQDPLVVEAKLAVPAAVYAIASRSGEADANRLIAQILGYAQHDRAQELLGSSGSSLEVQAIIGLGEAGERALPILDALTRSQAGETVNFSAELPGADAAVVDAIQATDDINPALLDKARDIAGAAGDATAVPEDVPSAPQ
jgi:hypothetical protein